MRKNAVLLLTIVLTGLLVLAIQPSPAFAQSIPEFTLKIVAQPYDVPTTYGIDSYSGKNITVQEGYHVDNVSVEITIKNQPSSDLYYNVRYKGHFGDTWTEVYNYYPGDSPGNLIPQNSNSAGGYTILSIPATFPLGEIDFQVQTLLWHTIQVFVYDHPLAPQMGGHYEDRYTLDRTSEWSNTQTVTYTTPAPIVTILSLQQENFSDSDVPLNFAVDKPVSQIEYSLDGRENVTTTGNTTLTGLSNGYHNVTVYATDEAGNIGDAEAFFYVEAPEPFSSLLVAAVSVAVVTVVAVAVMVYWKKHKR
jgi:hypothetical protein